MNIIETLKKYRERMRYNLKLNRMPVYDPGEREEIERKNKLLKLYGKSPTK